MATAKITHRQPDISRNFDWVRFEIDGKRYVAKVAGHDAWDIHSVSKIGASHFPAKNAAKVAEVMNRLLVNDEIAAMQK